MKPHCRQIRATASIAFGAVLLAVWLAPAAGACAHCPDSLTAAEVSCCSETAPPPPCACEHYGAHIPQPDPSPDCCPCGFQDTPADRAPIAVPVPPAAQTPLPLYVSSMPMELPAPSRPATTPLRLAYAAAPPAYLMDCALLR